MTGTRTQILDRVRRALLDVPAAEEPDDVLVPRDYHRAGTASEQDLIELFTQRAGDYGARVARVSERVVPGAIAAELAALDVATLVVPTGFPAEYLGCLDSVATLGDEPPLPVGSLDAAHGVISTCALAIAQTGTVILDAGPGQGRRALTLLPDYHLCLVQASQIVATVPDAIARLNPRAPLTMISGPSATSDIENDRVDGVHGPRTLSLLIIDPDPQPAPTSAT